jgi:hypothetical protein
VGELSSLGLPPEVLQRLIAETAIPKVVYELNHGKPQLRIWVDIPQATSSSGVTWLNSKLQGNVVGEEDAAGCLYHHKLLETLQPERTSSAGEQHTISEQRLIPVRYVN